MTESNTVPLNWIIVVVLVCVGAGIAALLRSPELMDRVALKLMARSRAMRASDEAWKRVYSESIHADLLRDEQTEELKRMIKGA